MKRKTKTPKTAAKTARKIKPQLPVRAPAEATALAQLIEILTGKRTTFEVYK